MLQKTRTNKYRDIANRQRECGKEQVSLFGRPRSRERFLPTRSHHVGVQRCQCCQCPGQKEKTRRTRARPTLLDQVNLLQAMALIMVMISSLRSLLLYVPEGRFGDSSMRAEQGPFGLSWSGTRGTPGRAWHACVATWQRFVYPCSTSSKCFSCCSTNLLIIEEESCFHHDNAALIAAL